MLTAAAYVMAGLVAKGLALSSGYATPLWPAAGVALLVGLLSCLVSATVGNATLNGFGRRTGPA